MAENVSLGEELRIRMREARDDADLLELFNQKRFRHYASARGPFQSVEELQAWLANIACARRIELVGAIGGKAIGFAGLFVMGDGLGHSGWILLGVNEAHQARGVGARLLHVLMASGSIVIGLRRIQLTVFADNDPAIRLYRRFGFETEGRHRNFLQRPEGFVDSLTLAKIYDAAPLAPVTAANATAA